MGKGKGDRGNPDRGRVRWPGRGGDRLAGLTDQDMGTPQVQTPYQELATELGDSSRARSQPPVRRPDGTHPMTTRQGTAPVWRPVADQGLFQEK